jgi:hypothetical protein
MWYKLLACRDLRSTRAALHRIRILGKLFGADPLGSPADSVDMDIFISHAVADCLLVREFVDLLMLGLNLKQE